uniref:flagellar protein MotY n=1 Tax=Thaumasiovibrio occultus TaxID=1891184 RepID=UPI000B35E6E0|nr:OmpA family protein [Thaumasiovibrio occultus]
MHRLVLAAAIAGAFIPSAFANQARQYMASPNESVWQMIADTPLECQVVHEIPSYGEAMFTSRASKQLNLDFELQMRRPMGETRNVNLVSMPAAWMPGDAAERMTQLKFFNQFDGYVGGQMAWTMLSELEVGRFPTFTYQDWHHDNKRVEVALSAVAFQQPFDEFTRCVSNLLPYSFEDISFTVLNFEQGSEDLNKPSQQRLAQIAEFVRYSDDIDLVLMATYSDSADGTIAEKEMSERRADRLEQYFLSLGLPPDRIQVESYGLRRPIADNDNPLGQGQNRRVVISLGRTII